jgi:hypothetical protein
MSSDISSAQSVNTPSQSSTPAIPPHFHSIIRTGRDAADSVPRERPDGTQRKRKSGGTIHYYCTICPNWDSGHLTNTIKHVISKHPPVRGPQVVRQPSTSTQPEISSYMGPNAPASVLRNAFDLQAYREAVVALLTRRRMPFAAVEWEEWTRLALACNHTIADLLITSRRTAVRHIIANHCLYRLQLKESLSASIGSVHISSDLWTSPHRHSLLAVCAQWVDSDYQLQKALLALPECKFTHSGRKQADLILRVLEDYNIQFRFGYHTGDNATSNDTCIEALAFDLLVKHGVRKSLAISFVIRANLRG